MKKFNPYLAMLRIAQDASDPAAEGRRAVKRDDDVRKVKSDLATKKITQAEADRLIGLIERGA